MKHISLRDVDAELGKLALALGEAVREQVGQGDDLDVLALGPGTRGGVLGVISGRGIDDVGGGAQGVEHRAGAAPAAADQADFDLDVACGLGRVDEGELSMAAAPATARLEVLRNSRHVTGDLRFDWLIGVLLQAGSGLDHAAGGTPRAEAMGVVTRD